MIICPFCKSKNIYFSKKRNIYVCEDCDETFSDNQISSNAESQNNTRKLNIFFSYGHDQNRPLVERLKQDLEARGHSVWIDTCEIKAGDNWRNSILNGIINSSSVIAFLSEHSTRNPGVCLDELKIAVCVKGANIKTVLLEPESKITPPATVADIQWLDMSAWFALKHSSTSAFEQWYKTKLDELCDVLESNNTAELNGDINLLKTKLTPYLNSEKEYNLLSKEFYGREWLKNIIDDWLFKHSTRALMIYGSPGTGKSAFSVYFSHFNPYVYGCFLCEWNRDYTINPNCLIKTIAFKLATKLPDYRKLLIRQLNDVLTIDEMNSEALFDLLLTYPFSHLINCDREPCVFIVDGLDEAENDGDNPLSVVFSKCIERLPKWIRFIFTSRPEQNVSKYFVSYNSVDLIKDMPLGYNDVMAYLAITLSEVLKHYSNKLEVLNKICELSDGIILYAELLCTDLKDGVLKPSDLTRFPKGLNSFYRVSMERKFPDKRLFLPIRNFLEMLSVSDSIPEKLISLVNGYTQYEYLSLLDKMGSWVNRFEENGIVLLSFSHKSFRDWFTNRDQSADFYVDFSNGALRTARFCRKYIEKFNDKADEFNMYLMIHIGKYYIQAREFHELEDFLLSHKNELDPYWRVWCNFPENWNHSKLLDTFWASSARNLFLQVLQREGNVKFIIWIFEIAIKKYGIVNFDKELITVYIDMVHMSGQYSKAVSIIDQYLSQLSSNISDEFSSMLSVRRIHHSMFFKPVEHLINEAMELFSVIDTTYPKVYNELLFLIGGNLGILYGDWNFCEKWLKQSMLFSESKGLKDFKKRNARKWADYQCYLGNYQFAEEIIKENVSINGDITGRYEAYLFGALANIYTCMHRNDEAIKYYELLMKHTTLNGIVGWTAHANLGIANINYKLGNFNEAIDFATRARSIYSSIQQEWGLIMTEAILEACKYRINNITLVDCNISITHAKKMQYWSSVSSIEDLCKGNTNFLKLYFL